MGSNISGSRGNVTRSCYLSACEHQRIRQTMQASDGDVAALSAALGRPAVVLNAGGVEAMLRGMCELAHAPHVWIVDCRQPDHRASMTLYHELYNCSVRRHAADADCAEADPLLLLVSPDASCVAAARALFFERMRHDDPADVDVGVERAPGEARGVAETGARRVRVYSPAPVASPASRLAQTCRDFTLILDLNGILVDKIFDPHAREVPDQLCHARHGAFAIVIRPGARLFLRWAFSAFARVVAWSSLRRDNVRGILQAAFGAELASLFSAVLGNEDSPRDEQVVDMKDGRNCGILKDLDFLADRIGGRVDRMVVVDDAEHKVRRHLGQAVIPRHKFDLTGGLLDPKVANDRGLFEVIKPAILTKVFQMSMSPSQATEAAVTRSQT